MEKELPIRGFTGLWRFLSNFHPHEGYYWDNEIYPTAEHAYQCQKATNDKDRGFIRTSKTPGEAKRRGNTIKGRRDWEFIKLWVMLKVVRRKFSSLDMTTRLISTGDRELIEENNWGDDFWGTVNGKGQNNLGKILMLVREELKNDL